jgi:hypothetical protein
MSLVIDLTGDAPKIPNAWSRAGTSVRLDWMDLQNALRSSGRVRPSQRITHVLITEAGVEIFVAQQGSQAYD